MSAARLVAVAAIVAGAAGCLALDPADGLLACNPSGKACPSGYFCDATNRCVRDGHVGAGGGDDLAVGGDDLAADGGGGDVDLANSTKPNGQACSAGSECASGVCADHLCCDRACDGQCEACDVAGSEGTCSLVTGAPHAPRASCNGSGACAGACDGTSKDCAYPSTQTICGAACDGTCDGAGTCSTNGGTCPNGYACGGAGGCKTSCTTQADCQPFFMCNAPNCVRVPESNCLDGIDNNGDGLADCADPTCAAIVECVPTPPSGGELGVHLTSGSCPTSYNTPEAYHTGLQPKSCTGCTCQTQCQATTNVYTGASCNTAPVSTVFSGPPTGSVICKNINATTYASGTLNAPALAGCVAGGTATQPDPTWTTNDTFCAAKTSNTCDAQHVCVAKPASTPVCARVDASASCPAGYTTTNGVYYADFMRGSCGSCSSCTQATSLTCTVGAFSSQALTGANCTGGGTLIDNTCGTLNRGVYSSVELALSSSGTDNCTTNVSSTPPTAIGSTRICCQ